jgi:hypothetical protein
MKLVIHYYVYYLSCGRFILWDVFMLCWFMHKCHATAMIHFVYIYKEQLAPRVIRKVESRVVLESKCDTRALGF